MVEFDIRVIMAERRMNQKQLSAITGIDKSAISRYYNYETRKIDLNHISIICDKLNCSPNDLFKMKSDQK